MSFHLIISKNGNINLEEIVRGMKKYNSFKIIGAIMENAQVSRKEWMQKLFEKHGKSNSNNTKYQYW